MGEDDRDEDVVDIEVDPNDPQAALATLLAVAMQDMFEVESVDQRVTLYDGATMELAFNVYMAGVRYPISFLKTGPFTETLTELSVQVRNKVIEVIPDFAERIMSERRDLDLREVLFRIIPPAMDKFQVAGNSTIH